MDHHHHPPPFRRFAPKVFDATSISAEPEPDKHIYQTKGYHSDVVQKPMGPKTHASHYNWKAMPRRKPSPPEKDFSSQTPQSSLKHTTSAATYNPASPQNRWSDVPFAFRPSEWMEPELSSRPIMTESLFPRRTNLSIQQPPQMISPKPRRRPEPLRSVSHGLPQSRDPTSLIFPPYNPYDDMRNVHSASFVHEHRPQPQSQPNTPSFWEHTQTHHLDERPASTIPYAAPVRSARNVTAPADDSDLEDDEFHLFAEAISGLGPEDALIEHSFQPPAFPASHPVQAIQPPSSQPFPPYEHHQHPEHPQPSLQIDPSTHSPLFTPTTRTAIHHIAQMPDPHSGPQPPSSSPRLSISPPQRRAPPSPLPYPNRPPHRDELEIYNVSPIEPAGLDDGEDDDDELPDYAASQAQAQEVQRVEAARRAQELQRKWRAGVGY